MISQLAHGISKLDELAFSFAGKQNIELEDLIFDGGIMVLDRDPHTVELRCNGSKKVIHLTTDEISNCSIGAQHKIIMALMHFVPHAPGAGLAA